MHHHTNISKKSETKKKLKCLLSLVLLMMPVMRAQFLEAFGRKKDLNIKYRCFCQKSRYLRSCLALVAESTIFTVLFWTAPSKNTCIYPVFIMLQEVNVPCKGHKTPVDYNVLGLLSRVSGGVEGGGPKMNSNLLNNQETGLATLLFTS